ncbi:hypothetical protein OG215_38200 (plasmid) [Streptomyces globisporus]|uniref:hypothetical protein n=1 Tax=Streptomyces globisporus TaxID=1908 RepID=UPI002F911178|nr:hypothetical protein OG215_38200 [Streptomyces globisporus]
MSTLAALVILLPVLVSLMALLALAYAVHRHPALAAPIKVAVAGAVLLATVVGRLMAAAGSG